MEEAWKSKVEQSGGSAVKEGKEKNSSQTKSNAIEIPSITLPKGGGALKSIDEKFQVNAANGTSSFSLPLPFSKSRNNFSPSLSVSYNSGGGNSPFGLGWNCELPFIQRKTDKKLPEYRDDIESDIFLFSGAEDLVPYLKKNADGNWVAEESTTTTGEKIKSYRPRIEGLFARIEKIKSELDVSFYWKVTTRDNIVTFFGRSEKSRISKPDDKTKVFKWLPDLSYDDKGNCIEFSYVDEDSINVPVEIHERNRLNGKSVFVNKYLSNVKYGNSIPYFPDPTIPYSPPSPENADYLYETVLDYDDHNNNKPERDADLNWRTRTDAFSEYKSGFEIRTYRLCKRILFFHNFKELSPSGIMEATLVRSINFSYQEFLNSTNSYSEADFIKSIQQLSYKRNSSGSYDSGSLPPIEFSYHELNWNTEVKTVSEENFQHAPAGIDNNYQWTDFFGEGVSGILTEQGSAWYYKRNLGDGTFSIAQPLISKPNLNGISTGLLQMVDIESNGKKYIISRNQSLSGYYEQTNQEDFLPFHHFENELNIDFSNPDIKFIDLNGDGIPDAVLSEENVFSWWQSMGTKGFKEEQRSGKPYNEEDGPAIVFSDKSQNIYLADMSGDGLADIVRVRNAEICYWPNLGYGNFGAKVNMKNAPVFSSADEFNPSYLRLNDISGTGATDIIYLAANTFKVWFNQSGNSFSDPKEIQSIPSVVQPNTVNVMDFLGNGTGCIVWSSPLLNNATSPLRYIDLMGGKKPFILSNYKNNFGKTTTIEYKSSTQYYLEDQKKGTPWITKLPFPVQCVSKTIHEDEVTGLRFTNSYTYHHGYYDHFEREFRGFGRVEQTDTENFNDFKLSGASNIVSEELHQPEVLSKTWFHTGAYFDRERIFNQFSEEYFQNSAELQLVQPVLSDELTAQEWREALRSCKGIVLRKEIYSNDLSGLESIPYSLTEHNCYINILQPCLTNKHAVFLVKESESVTYNYERDISDPRILHTLNIEFDDLGNILQSISIAYGRKKNDFSLPSDVQSEQEKLYILYTKNNFTNDVLLENAYRLRLPCEVITYELTGLLPASTYFSINELESSLNSASEIKYEETADGVTVQKRRVEHQRTLFMSDDSITPLPLGKIESLGLGYENYLLAYTDSLITYIFDTRISNTHLEKGNYTNSSDYKSSGLFPSTDSDNEWWIRSGTTVLFAAPWDSFYLPEKYIDPLGSETKLTYYSNYHLLIEETEDAIGNTTKVMQYDFYTLSPLVIQDMNGCTSEIALDVLGRVVGSSISGNHSEGDSLSGFTSDLTPTQIEEFFNDPETYGALLLGNATSRFIYDLSRTTFKTVAAASIVREKHLHQLESSENSPVQISFEFSDGSGQLVMKKVQAEPGTAKQLDDLNNVLEVDTGSKLRWVGNGRTIFNNKGKPIKQFEPYFSTSHAYEDESGLVEIGVSPILYYDPLDRLIQTDFPNGTFTKVEFTTWAQKSFDNNDTIMDSKWYSERTSGSLASDVEENTTAINASLHYNTPLVTHLDSLGRAFYNVEHNAFTDGTTGSKIEEYYATYITFDVEGNQLVFTDAKGNVAMEYKYNLLGNISYQRSIDAGECWILNDVTQKPFYKFDSKETIFHFEYDVLHRPTSLTITEVTKSPVVVMRTEYGESYSTSSNYLRGRSYRIYDGSGVATIENYDFKGNVVTTKRKITEAYNKVIDWTTIESVVLLPDEYITETTYDALNRPFEIIAPDKSVFSPAYNEAMFLESMTVNIKGIATHNFVTDINYNEKGQRTEIFYGNNSKTDYEYDPETFRLTRVLTTRNSGADILQDLNYTYDPVGNISFIKDNAQQTVFFNNAVVDSGNEYTYDAIYRLIKATGREHAGNNTASNEYDSHRMFQGIIPSNGSALQNYCQYYEYDAVGNILKMIQNGGTGCFTNRWTRNFTYDTTSNRLLHTQIGSDPIQNYNYDVRGNMITMPHLSSLNWNYADQLQSIDRDGSNAEKEFNTAYYTYDANGDRVRKVITHANGITEERLYLGAIEIYTKKNGNSILVRRETLHVIDAKSRVAMVDTKTIENDIEKNESLIRYQYDNHLGTACLETDENAKIISYEEYYPFGSTSYQCSTNEKEVPEKRYRYTGKERDEESGLEYHAARYYIPWLGRWLSTDPAGISDGLNLYRYTRNNPIKLIDVNGMAPLDPVNMTLESDVTGAFDYKFEGSPYKLAKEVRISVEVRPGVFVEGRVDRVIQDLDGNLFYKEMKFDSYSSFTDNQRDYIPAIREGAPIRILDDQPTLRNVHAGHTEVIADRYETVTRWDVGDQARRHGLSTPSGSSIIRRTPGGIETRMDFNPDGSPRATTTRPTRPSAGARFGGGALVVADVFGMYMDARDQVIADQGMSRSSTPAILEDEFGTYNINIESGWIYDQWSKFYLTGELAGTSVDISYWDRGVEIEKRNKKYGYFDWKGELVEGEIPPQINWDDCYEAGQCI